MLFWSSNRRNKVVVAWNLNIAHLCAWNLGVVLLVLYSYTLGFAPIGRTADIRSNYIRTCTLGDMFNIDKLRGPIGLLV